MYAIVTIAGQQFKINENTPVFVHRLDAKEGDTITFDQVMMIGGNGSVTVGTPTVSGASITAKVIAHVKGDKVLVFKKKRRKGYQKMNGHRQSFTKIHIDKIIA